MRYISYNESFLKIKKHISLQEKELNHIIKKNQSILFIINIVFLTIWSIIFYLLYSLFNKSPEKQNYRRFEIECFEKLENV